MNMMKACSLLSLALLSVAPVFSQENPASQELIDKALFVSIDAKIVSQDRSANWSFRAVKITIPGKPVLVQIKGKNITLNLVFTPYQQENEKQVLLVAQGQIWLKEAGTGEAKYLTTLKSIPVVLGEKIRFYPLGMGDTETFTIQLEIEIIRYADFVSSQQEHAPENGTPDGASSDNTDK